MDTAGGIRALTETTRFILGVLSGLVVVENTVHQASYQWHAWATVVINCEKVAHLAGFKST